MLQYIVVVFTAVYLHSRSSLSDFEFLEHSEPFLNKVEHIDFSKSLQPFLFRGYCHRLMEWNCSRSDKEEISFVLNFYPLSAESLLPPGRFPLNFRRIFLSPPILLQTSRNCLLCILILFFKYLHIYSGRSWHGGYLNCVLLPRGALQRR